MIFCLSVYDVSGPIFCLCVYDVSGTYNHRRRLTDDNGKISMELIVKSCLFQVVEHIAIGFPWNIVQIFDKDVTHACPY